MISLFVQQWLVAVLATAAGYGLGGGRPAALGRALAIVLAVWIVVFLVALLPLPSPLDFLIALAAGALAARSLLRAARP